MPYFLNFMRFTLNFDQAARTPLKTHVLLPEALAGVGFYWDLTATG